MVQPQKHIYREKYNFAILDILSICFLVIMAAIVYSYIKETIYFDTTELIIQFGFILFMLLIFINFRTLQVTLYPDFIEARYGLIAKKIMLKDISSITKYRYSFWEFLGWGIRASFSGKLAYNIIGDKFCGILINYTSKDKPKELFVSFRNTTKLSKLLNDMNLEMEINLD